MQKPELTVTYSSNLPKELKSNPEWHALLTDISTYATKEFENLYGKD